MSEKDELSRQCDERRRRDAATLRAVMGDLATVGHEDAAILSHRNPMMAALQAIAQAEKITIGRLALEPAGREPLQSFADATGVRTRRILLRGKWWERDSGALLGFMSGTEAPVALLPTRSRLSGNQYELLHPANGLRIPVDGVLASKLSTVAYLLVRPLPGDCSLREMVRFSLSGLERDVGVIVVCGVIAALLGMLLPQATALIVDHAIPDGNRNLLFTIALGLGAAAAGAFIFDFVQAVSLLRIEAAAGAAVQTGIWEHLLKLRPSFFRSMTAGDLQSRANAVSAIQQRLSGPTLMALFSATASLLNAALMMYFSFSLAVIAIIFAVVVTALMTVFSRKVMHLTPALQAIEGELSGLVVQLIDAVPKLRIAGAESRAFAYWAARYSRKQKLQQSTMALQDRVRLLNGVVPTLGTAMIFGTAMQLLQQASGPLSLGTFLAFNAAFTTFLLGITTFSETVLSLLSVGSLWKRTRTIVDEEPEVQYSTAQDVRLRGSVKLDRVAFRYRDDGPLTLDNVTIEANPGECIALVGPSGSGKSTIINLLLGFEKPLSGAVYYDDHDLKGLNVMQVRRQIGVVMQDNKIMAGSIFENIVCGGLATLSEAQEAAGAAGLAQDIERMPMGMHTVISEGGTNLSGGQKQRLLIARALVVKPRILILDEATSALDNRTQSMVVQHLDRLNITRIVVAHRLTTVRQADRIYVIDSGRVVQSGTFASLTKEEGLFMRLMARQMA